jgi:N-formylglutamate amidohydrolase
VTALTAGQELAPPFAIAGFDSAVPIVGVSLHASHVVRPQVAERLAIADADRLREEDPGTDRLAAAFGARVAAGRSRFEVDLNRPPGRALYREPGEAWGLEVWKGPLPAELEQESLQIHRDFYRALHAALDAFAKRHARFVVLDLHSYNHRRRGAEGPLTDPALAPEINVGTRTLERDYWAPVVDAFVERLSEGSLRTGALDVRENVNFFGGYFPAWVNATFPRTACALAVEIKKTYVDEWTGRIDDERLDALVQTFRSALPGPLVAALARLEAAR